MQELFTSSKAVINTCRCRGVFNEEFDSGEFVFKRKFSNFTDEIRAAIRC